MEIIKVVINTEPGGFSLSNKACEWLHDKRGWEITEFNERGEFIDEEAKLFRGKNKNIHMKFSLEKGVRTNPDLIECVETLKDEASRRLSNLEVIEIPDDTDWYIDSRNGAEWVAEEHRTWS